MKDTDLTQKLLGLQIYSWLAIGIWMIGIIIRILIFNSTEYYTDGGEALVGLMGRDILYGKSLPVLLYGHAFEGGGALMAYMAVPFFWLFGVSSFSLKLATFLLYTITYIVGYLWIKRHLNSPAAVGLCLILSISPPVYTIWSLRAYGTHDLILVLIFGILWLHWEILFKNKNNFLGYLLFGLFSGFSIWMHPGVIPVVLVCLVISYLHQSGFIHKLQLDGFLLGFLIGWSPILFYNILTNWRNIEWILTAPYTRDIIHNLQRLLSEGLPYTFAWTFKTNWKIYDGSIDLAKIYGYFCYITALAILICFLFQYRNEFKTFIRRLIFFKLKEPWTPSIPVILVVYTILWTLMCVISPWSSFGTQYGFYWYFFPFFIPFFVGFVYLVFGQQNITIHFAGKIKTIFRYIFVLFISSSFLFNIQHIREGTVLKNSKDEFKDVLRFLYDNHLRYIYTVMWAKPRLDFDSDGYLRTTDKGLSNEEFPIYSFLHFREIEKVTYALAGRWDLQRQFDTYLKQYNVPHDKKTFETIGRPPNWTIYYNFQEPLRPNLAFQYGDLAKIENTPGLKINISDDNYPNGAKDIPFHINKYWSRPGGFIPRYWCATSPAWTEIVFPEPVSIDYILIRFPDWYDLKYSYQPMILDHDKKSFQKAPYPKEYHLQIEYWDEENEKYMETYPPSIKTRPALGWDTFLFSPVITTKFKISIRGTDKDTPYIYIYDIICRKTTHLDS